MKRTSKVGHVDKKITPEKILKLSWKRVLLFIAAWIVAAILHNVFYAIFGFEEAVFFIIAVIILPLYFIISLIYTTVEKIIDYKNK